MTNPLLDTLALPRFGEIRPEHIAPALDRVIGDHRAVVARIVEDRPTSFAQSWMPLERAETAIAAVWSTVIFLRLQPDATSARTRIPKPGERVFFFIKPSLYC